MSSTNMPGNAPGLPEVVDNSDQAVSSLQASSIPAATATPAAHGTGAQDTDTIEEAWVHRVEQLLHEYGDDPQKLSAQFTHLKIEYIAKRYGKQIGEVHQQD